MKIIKIMLIVPILTLFFSVACSPSIVDVEPPDEVTTAVPKPPGVPANEEQVRTREPFVIDMEDGELIPATKEPDVRVLPTEKSIIPPPLEDLSGDSNDPIATNDENVTLAKEDLSQREGIPLAEIELVSYESVIWRDGSLGCPNPKANYIQVSQEGYLIQLKANGQTYDYHGQQGRSPFLCVTKLGEVPVLPGRGGK